MHELSIAENILEVINGHTDEGGYTRCLSATVRVGLLTAVDEDALRFAFESLCDGTRHHGAGLVVERTFPSAGCACGCRFEVTDLIYTCPECGAVSAPMSGGDELDIIRLELE